MSTGARLSHSGAFHLVDGAPGNMHKIGPNSVTQLEAACDRVLGRDETVYLFTAAGFHDYLKMPPIKMVPEDHPARLFSALYRLYPRATADKVAGLAGQLTADYVIENRIPALAANLLRWMPANMAGRGLLKAIRKNSWTFAGSGQCVTRPGGTPNLAILNNPLRMPGRAWHVGVFERLFRRLVCAHATVDYQSDDTSCSFDVNYGLPKASGNCPLVKEGNAPPFCANCTLRLAD